MARRIRIKFKGRYTLSLDTGYFFEYGKDAVLNKGGAPVTPVWGSAPQITVDSGDSITQFPLNVSVQGGGAINIGWSNQSTPSSKPAWVNLNSGTNPTISFTGAQADSDDLNTVYLTASVAGGGSSTSPKGYITVLQAQPNWTNPQPTTVPFFNTGIAQPYDLTTWLQNFNPATQTVTQKTGADANFSLVPTGVITFDGSATVGTYPMTFEVVDNQSSAQADWAARSAGAMYAENWSSYTTAADFFNRHYLSGWPPCSKTPAMGATWTNAYEIVNTAGHVLSGKAFRLYHGKNASVYDPTYFGPGVGGSPIDNQWFIVPANGDKSNPASAWKTKLYVQYIFWTDEYVDYNWLLGPGIGSQGGPKFAILDTYASSGNWIAGEIVQMNQYGRGFIHAYRRSTGGSDIEIGDAVATPANNNNVKWQNAIDRGGATPVTQNEWERRYGPCAYGMTGGTSQLSKLSTQGVPDPDAAIGGIAINRGGLHVVEVMADVPNQRIQIWQAAYGNTPILTHDTGAGNALIGDRVAPGPINNNTGAIGGTGYSGLTLTNLMFHATEEVNPQRPAASYTDYVELIFSESPIPVPQQLTTPLPGVNQYITTFAANESPISESGKWSHAANAWKTVRTSGGNALAAAYTEGYDDAYAIYTGSVGANYEIEGTVFNNGATTGEIELLLRCADTSSTMRCYECLFGIHAAWELVRWNGSLGSFTQLQSGSKPTMATGDKIRARIVGSTIQIWYIPVSTGVAQQLGTTYTGATDYPTGQPGFAFYVHAADANLNLVGLSDWKVTAL